eukprot:1117131-Pleurochrysis_carterae.AAC.3
MQVDAIQTRSCMAAAASRASCVGRLHGHVDVRRTLALLLRRTALGGRLVHAVLRCRVGKGDGRMVDLQERDREHLSSLLRRAELLSEHETRRAVPLGQRVALGGAVGREGGGDVLCGHGFAEEGVAAPEELSTAARRVERVR